jgi:hypothetical protein
MTEVIASMESQSSILTPRRWLRVGKYLLPLGVQYAGWRRTKSPCKQVPVTQLAAEHTDQVSLQTLGEVELLSEYAYECYASGKREHQVLPSSLESPAFVAELQNGSSFGRHCCAIGPAGMAIRETGFNLDGNVSNKREPISRLRLRYWRRRWEGDVTSRPWLPPKQRIDGRVAVLNTRTSHNYFHWLIDILPRIMPLRQLGLEAEYYLVDCLTPFQQSVLELLGIERHQLIQPHCRLLLEAEQLLVPSLPTPACLRSFGRLITDRIGIQGSNGPAKRIYITRRQTGTRTIANEAQLEDLLLSRGFEIHAMEEYSLREQATLIHQAEVIVATHGAGLANLIFAKPGTNVIEIVPEKRYNATCYPKKSRILGLRHQQVLVKSSKRKQILQVSLDDVASALSQADNSVFDVREAS